MPILVHYRRQQQKQDTPKADAALRGDVTHIHLSLIDNVEIVSLVALLNDHVAGVAMDRKHGIEYVTGKTNKKTGEVVGSMGASARLQWENWFLDCRMIVSSIRGFTMRTCFHLMHCYVTCQCGATRGN